MTENILTTDTSLKISLITATYNSSKTIDTCLDSIASQTYQNVEHIIVDGLSDDKTLDKINAHMHSPSKIICERDNGIYDALNKGIQNSTGDIIGFLHSDDFFSNSEVLQKIINKFLENKSLSAVYGDCEFISKTNNAKIIRKWKSRKYFPKLLSYGWMPPHAALFMKTKLIKSVNGFDSRFKISGDYDCILKTFKKENFQAYHLPEVILRMRMGGKSNRSISSIVLKTKEDWIVLRQNNFSLLLSIRVIIFKNLSKIVQFL
tara:strand:- start:1392 stop:2177 length:786 start_codon:yes stop_codon:yes gene_type:complete